MTHFATAGTKTAAPQSLSLLAKVGTLLTGVTVPRPTAAGKSPADLGLAFETHRLGGNGVELEAWHVPHRQARGLVLLFHGYAACKAALLPQARAFHDIGFAVFLVDFRGGGGSSGSVTTIGVAEAEDVALAYAHARRLCPRRPLILYGQSMGAAAVLRAIAVHDVRPTAVVLESTFDRLLTTVCNRFTAMGLPTFPGARLLVFWGGVQHGFNGFAHNPVDYARAVRCPALLLYGTDDPWVSAAEQESIRDNLGGAVRLEVFPGAGHEELLSRQPERWRRVVAAFLDEHASPPAAVPADSLGGGLRRLYRQDARARPPGLCDRVDGPVVYPPGAISAYTHLLQSRWAKRQQG
jgi:alpha-beta hydrolase superfamily lysophospholipase